MGRLAGNDVKFDFSGFDVAGTLRPLQSKANLLCCNSKYFKIERVPQLIGSEFRALAGSSP